MKDSQPPQNFQIQDPYSMFLVPQQEEKPIDFEKRIENMIQYQNNFIQSNLDCTQSINRLDAQKGHLVNTINDKTEETLPTPF